MLNVLTHVLISLVSWKTVLLLKMQNVILRLVTTGHIKDNVRLMPITCLLCAPFLVIHLLVMMLTVLLSMMLNVAMTNVTIGLILETVKLMPITC